MPDHEIVIKQVEPQLVAAIRAVVPHYRDVGGLMNEVYGHLSQHGAHGGLCASIYHDGEYRERDVDCEGVVFLERPVPAAGRVKVYQLPATSVASTVHHGGYSGLTQAYSDLMSWISASGYSIAGPERELYLRGPATPGDQNDANCVTEIQFPVTKA